MIPSTCIFSKTIKKIIFIGIVLLVSSKCIMAQYNIDSIKALSYKEFEKYFEKSYVDSVKDLIYANAFLEKAKKDKDTINIADAYLSLSDVHKYQVAIKYVDSTIIITKNIVGHKKYPALGYMYKGVVLYNMGKLQMAIDQYVIAHQFAKRSKNNALLAKIKANMGLIKNRLGEKEEALTIFKDFVDFVEKSEISSKDQLLAQGLLTLGITYISTQKYDSASIMIKKGMTISRQKKYIDIYAILLNLYGINLFYTKNYQASIDSISKALLVYDLQNNIPFAYLFLGKSNLALGDTSTALHYFFKVDSFLCNNSFITQELLEAYSPVIEYFSKRKDYARQLFYTNQLIKFDSVFNATRAIVTKDIAKKYEIPLLLASKEELIDKLNKDKYLSTMGIYLLLIFSFLLIGTATYFILKNRRNLKRFDKLPRQLSEKEINKDFKLKTQDIEEIKTGTSAPVLDSNLVDSILDRLDKFEKSCRFTRKNYTIISLAKELKTNNAYLSIIIKEHRGQKFSDYLNNLRIDYAIKRLRSDLRFSTYTIQAIAEETGFNNGRTFSSAFSKKMGLHPSDFIKQLGNKETGELP